MSRLTPDDAQALLDAFAGNETVLSCYADLSTRGGVQSDHPLQALAKSVRRTRGPSAGSRRDLDENLNAVHVELETMARDGARWAAVFSADGGLHTRSVLLAVPVRNELVLDGVPYLVPLLLAEARRREYLVVHPDNGRGRVYASTPGAARVVHVTRGDASEDWHPCGRRDANHQADSDRRRADHALRCQKDLGRAAERAWDAGAYTGVVLLGEHTAREHLLRVMPSRLACRVLWQVPAPWHDSPRKGCAVVRALAEELFRAQDAGSNPELAALVREGKAATGKYAVIDALQSGRLGAAGHGYIAIGPDTHEIAGRCAACRILVPDPAQPCPRCQSDCRPVGLWQEMLLSALRHQIATLFVGDPDVLRTHGCMAAVLPRA